MGSGIKSYGKTIASELAEAISSFDTAQVANLLSDNGEFAVQNERYEIEISGKHEFITWLSSCYRKISFAGLLRKRLSFEIVQCMHCVTGNPIIIFESGRFPVFSGSQTKNEQSGLVIKSFGNKITGIELCFLVMKTENPFIYEKKCLRPVL
jgi:hypothetical protein